MNSNTTFGPASILVGAVAGLLLSLPLHANDSGIPNYSSVSPAAPTSPPQQSTKMAKKNTHFNGMSLDVVSAILAKQALQSMEPEIGAAAPTAAASYSALTAAQQANAQRAASALAQRPPVSTANAKTLKALATAVTPGSANVHPGIVVNSATVIQSTDSEATDTRSLTINIELPQEVLKTDSAGNLQSLTINLSFPDNL